MKTTLPALLCLASLLLAEPAASAQSTTRVSVTTAGAQVFTGSSEVPSFSHTGRYVAFDSNAPGLVPGDVNNLRDLFVRDLYTGALVRESLTSAGVAPNGHCDFPVLSADGRFLAFRSFAFNLDPADIGLNSDIYLRDRQLGTTTLMSKDSFGAATSTEASLSPAISADGRYVAFDSTSTTLVPEDSNAMSDIFVHDRITGFTSRVSLMNVSPPPPDKNQATGHCYNPTISGDGRFVAFASEAGNLVTGDANSKTDIFLRDRLLGSTTLISRSTAGVQGDGHSNQPFITPDGAFIAYESSATNLVAGDTNSQADIFVFDRVAGTTERASVSSAGVQGDKGSQYPAISGDGRLVAFQSEATNLVPGDSNDRSDVFVRDPQGCAAGGAWIGYGAGLAGTGGVVPGIFGLGCPLPGATVTLRLDGIVGGTSGVLFVGLGSAAVPFKGGTFHVGALMLALNLPVGGAPGVAGAGALDLPAPLPAVPALSGLSVYLQGAFADSAAVQQVSLTQGLQMTIG